MDEKHSGSSYPAPSQPPPSYAQATPPAGYRIPLSTESLQQSDREKASSGQMDKYGRVPTTDKSGERPVYICSAILPDSVQPAKYAAHLDGPVRFSYGGKETKHKGRFDILPITEEMEWVPTAGGQVPQQRRPVEAGYEKDGKHLFHALANVNGTQVPGKTAPHLRGANVPFGSKEVVVRDDYAILCWK